MMIDKEVVMIVLEFALLALAIFAIVAVMNPLEIE
jgi:hypothetical protein